jgi:hypothetical protein
MTPMPCNEGIILTTSQVVFAFIFYAMCQYQFPCTLLTIDNLNDMNKFLCIYQSPYCLSVDNAFFCFDIGI